MTILAAATLVVVSYMTHTRKIKSVNVRETNAEAVKYFADRNNLVNVLSGYWYLEKQALKIYYSSFKLNPISPKTND